MYCVSTPPRAMPKLGPMWVSVGRLVPSFATSFQRASFRTGKPMQVMAVANVNVVASAADDL